MAEGKPRALRAVARCSSLEEFIAGFARFAEQERLFVITSEPKAPGGPAQPFVIQLADGSTALKGVGLVVEQHLIPTGPEGKCGMWLRLVDLTPASKEVHRQLLERRDQLASARKPEAPTLPAPKPRSQTIRVPAVVPPIAARPAIVPEATPPPGPIPTAPMPQTVPMRPTTRDELLEKARRLAGPSPHREERVPPSPFQLPANPLATMDDESLGHFVECMIYENSELVDVDSFAEPTEVRPVAYDPTSGEPPQSLTPPPSPTPVPSDAPFPSIAPPVPIVAPPFFVPPPAASRRSLFISSAASVVIGIFGGWLMFGRSNPAPPPAPIPSTQRPSPSPSPAAATTTATTTAATTTTATTTAAATAPNTTPEPPTVSATAPAPAPAVSPPRPAASPSGACVLTVRTTPPGVHVEYGTLDLGESPVVTASVPCGEAPVVLTHPRYERVARTATASLSAPATLDVHMQRPAGALTLRSIPPGATFTVDGETVGRGTVTAKVLAFETLHVSATLPGYAPWHGTTKLRGTTGTLFAHLTRTK